MQALNNNNQRPPPRHGRHQTRDAQGRWIGVLLLPPHGIRLCDSCSRRKRECVEIRDPHTPGTRELHPLHHRFTMQRPAIIGEASINAGALSSFTMPESAAAHTNVQRALHSLLLDDNISAAGYLRRALYFLEGEGGDCGGQGIRRRRSDSSSSTVSLLSMRRGDNPVCGSRTASLLHSSNNNPL